MGSKLGAILTLAFAVQVLCFMGDLTCLQATAAQLDACSIGVSRLIARYGKVNTTVRVYALQNYNAFVTPITTGTAAVGSTYVYEIKKEYVPISFLEPFDVVVTRTAIIGYME